MRFNGKVALLLLGLCIGGGVGYATRPETAEIRIGGTTLSFSNNTISTGSSASLTAGQSEHVLLYAAIGGLIGLLGGFAANVR
jgi:hypothetical protein